MAQAGRGDRLGEIETGAEVGPIPAQNDGADAIRHMPEEVAEAIHRVVIERIALGRPGEVQHGNRVDGLERQRRWQVEGHGCGSYFEET